MTKEMKSNDWNELRKIIDDGMGKRDREVIIGFYESATLVTVKPMSTDEEALPEAQKEESEKPKNEIIVRVPHSKAAQNEMVCCEEELKNRKVKVVKTYDSGAYTTVETEHYRIVFFPYSRLETCRSHLFGRNIRAACAFSDEEMRAVFKNTAPYITRFPCFMDVLDILF